MVCTLAWLNNKMKSSSPRQSWRLWNNKPTGNSNNSNNIGLSSQTTRIMPCLTIKKRVRSRMKTWPRSLASRLKAVISSINRRCKVSRSRFKAISTSLSIILSTHRTTIRIRKIRSLRQASKRPREQRPSSLSRHQVPVPSPNHLNSRGIHSQPMPFNNQWKNQC